jgi:hypothetical protein
MPGVRAFPDSSHSVQCWYAQRRRKVSVRSSSGRSFLQCETHSPSESCCAPEKSHGSRSAFHRRAIQTALYFQDAVTVPNAQSTKFAFDPSSVNSSRNTDIHLGPCLRRYHVRPRSTLNGTGIHGDSPLQFGEPLDDFDLVRQLGNGRMPLFEIDAAMRSNAGYVDVIVANTLARCLVGARIKALRRFEHIDRLALPRQLLGHRPRNRAANFFLADQKHRHRAAVALLAQILDGGQSHGHAGFHIQHAWTPHAALLDAKGHGGKGAQWPDRVQMAEQQNGLCPTARAAEAQLEQIPKFALPVALDPPPQQLRASGYQVNAAVHCRLLFAGRLYFDK